jgi:hypothetical protein
MNDKINKVTRIVFLFLKTFNLVFIAVIIHALLISSIQFEKIYALQLQ